jgi:hypothetical protein
MGREAWFGEGAGFVRGADGPDVLFSGLSNSTGRWPNRVDEHQAILYQPGFFTGI